MKTKISSLSLLAAGILATAALTPAHAVELQQKWQTGQSLNYDLSLNGTANVGVPATAKLLFAGVPLEVEVAGTGLARLNTLEVSPTGDGTVAAEVPSFDLNGRVFGQKILLELRDGQPRLLINGQPSDMLKVDPNRKPNKAYGLIIGKNGRIKSVKELDKNGKLLAVKPEPVKPAVADDEKPVPIGNAIDRGAMISSMIFQAMPVVWPQRDVQVGETWKTTLPFPAAFARDAATAQGAAPLSEWTMTLKGQEEVDGVSLWRVGIVGGLQVDGKNLAKPVLPKKGGNPVPSLENLMQRVDGDLWIDNEKGQVKFGEMVIDMRAQGKTFDAAGRASDPAWGDFTGTFKMSLRDAVAK